MMTDYLPHITALCRTDFLSTPSIFLDGTERNLRPLASLPVRWVLVRGISDFAEEYSPEDCASLMERVLTSIACTVSTSGVNPFVMFRLTGTGERIQLRIGCCGDMIGVLTSSLQAIYPGIDLQAADDICDELYQCGGVLTGYATMPPAEPNIKHDLPLDSFLRGIGTTPFSLSVFAELQPSIYAASIYQNLSATSQIVADEAERQVSDAQGVSHHIVNYSAKLYQTELDKALDMCRRARQTAMWNVQVFYAANSAYEADHLGGLLFSSLNGNSDAVTELVVCRRLAYKTPSLKSCYPAVIGGQVEINIPLPQQLLNSNPFSTVAGSRELARLLTLPRKEYVGYYVNQFVQFDVDNRPSSRTGEYHLGSIVRTCQPGAPSEGSYTLELDVLTRHALIIGLTGGGKTNTGKGLLKSLWLEHRVPFLVIESAKREYWEMSALADERSGNLPFTDLNVFTLGDENPETASPFRINPMEAMPGVSLQSHIDYLLSTFKAAFELYPPMPYVLETAVYKVYEDRGWDIVTGRNRYGLNRYPMLADLLPAVDEVTDSLGYYDEVQSNVKAALKARIGSLMIGGKNFLMNTPQSMDMEYLLSRPTILELEDLGDDDTKAFVIGILLVRIYEYHKSVQFNTANRAGGGKHLRHVIMIEEAHRLLKNIQGGGEGNQTREKAVEFFCNMLAEIRSFGQSFFIADQVPTKLAPDTLKNTNLKIIHRTVMEEDRLAVGKAMNMTEEQIAFLSALRVGHAAVFSEGDNRPKLVRFPLQVNRAELSRRDFIQACSRRIRSECPSLFVSGRGTEACRWCPACCEYGDACRQMIDAIEPGDIIGTFRLCCSGNTGGQALLDTVDAFIPDRTPAEKLCFAGYVLQLVGNQIPANPSDRFMDDPQPPTPGQLIAEMLELNAK